MSDTELLLRFRSEGITDDELVLFLNWHFSTSSHSEKDRHVYYPAQENPEVILSYNAVGELQSVSTLSMAANDLDKLIKRFVDDYIGDVLPGVGEIVLLNRCEVQGAWRYGDMFQILPVPSSAPRPPFAYAEHPFLLEFAFSRCRNGHTSGYRQRSESRRIVLLLNALIGNGIRDSQDFSQRWMMVKDETTKSGFRSEYLQQGYIYDSIPHKGTFTSTDEFGPINVQSANQYYLDVPGAYALTIPSDLTDSLNCFFRKPLELQNRFLRACYWLQQSDYTKSFSLSFITIVQAIESLLPLATTEGRCSACQREIKSGPTKLFKEFMDEFAPIETEFQNERKRLYEIRSNLTHGNRPPFRSDTRISMGLNPLDADERRHFRNALQAVRIAMRNWLQSDCPRIYDKPKVLDLKSMHAFSDGNH